MIVCRKCSRRHADGAEFCACGAFLEFDGEHVADPVEPTATQAPPATASGRAGGAPSVSAPSRGDVASTEPAPWSGLSGESNWGASSPPAGVDAVLPDVPTRPVGADPVWVEPTARAGDVPCSNCSTPNAPERQFCRHCGHPLALSGVATAAVATVRTPWWRRLGRKARRRAQRADLASMANSARRLSGGGVGGRTVAFRGGVIAMVVFSLLAFLGPWKGTVLAGARKVLGGDRFAVIDDNVDVEEVPTAAIPPAEFHQQGPENVRDHHMNTAWATRWISTEDPGSVVVPSDGTCLTPPRTDAQLVFSFEEPTDLARIRILGGRYADDPDRGLFYRPFVVELEVDGTCDHIDLDDSGELSIDDFSHRDVREVKLRIVDVFADQESSPTVEISEVVFDRRR